MFDFHSHILPGIDDGSKSVEESLSMLRSSRDQGVDGIAATSHFYANIHTPEIWLEKREAAFEKLKPHLSADLPKIHLGAEVHYYEGMILSDKLPDFRIEGTEILLVEMPFSKWTERMQSAIIELNSEPDITVLLAHIERYLQFQSRRVFEKLRENGVLIQSNAEFFLDKRTKRKALRMLEKDEINLLGSDCHNMSDRKPCLEQAYKAITEALGTEKIREITDREKSLFNIL